MSTRLADLHDFLRPVGLLAPVASRAPRRYQIWYCGVICPSQFSLWQPWRGLECRGGCPQVFPLFNHVNVPNWPLNCNCGYREIRRGAAQGHSWLLPLVRELAQNTLAEPLTDDSLVLVQEKKYTKDHEWIELSEDGKIGSPSSSTPLPTHQAFLN